MISFHAALSPDRRLKMTIPDSSRKRKWGDVVGEGGGGERSSGTGKPGSFALDTGLRLEEPLWQERVDTQPGEVRFCESRTSKSTCKDCGITTTSDPPTDRRAVSLNLELNLQPYDEYLPPQEAERTASSTRRLQHSAIDENPRGSSKKAEQSAGGGGGEEEEEEEEEGVEKEMVATVCGRCHMLVMLCVSRPCCPNCKFLNPKPDQTPFTLLSFRPPPPKCTTAQLLC